MTLDELEKKTKALMSLGDTSSILESKTLYQLITLVRLQNNELKEWCEDVGQPSQALAAFDAFEKGEVK